MSESCPHCGQTLRGEQAAEHRHRAPAPEPAHADAYAIVPDIGTTDDIAAAESRSTARKQAARSGALSGALPKILGAVVALAVLSVLASLAFGGGDVADEARADETPAIDQVIEDAAPDDAAPRTGSSSNGVGGDPNFPPSDDHLAADRVGDLFRLTIDADQSYSVVYPSQQGLQVLSADGVTVPELQVATGFEEAARFPLLSDGGQTWAVNPRNLDTVYLVSTQFVVVDVGLEGSVAFINSSIEPTNVGISSFGAWGPGYDVPRGAEVVPVPGRGLLILPATGGTFQLTQVGAEKISDDRIVAAGLRSEIYQRCDDRLDCELYVSGVDTDEPVRLEVDSEAPVFVSPEGEHVLAVEDGLAHLTTVATGEKWQVVEGDIAAVGWSPDGRFVAFISGDDLVMAFPEEQRVEATTLPIQPASDHLLVVAS